MKHEIDWNAQWEMHSPNFTDGSAHIHFPSLGLEKKSCKKKPCWKSDSIRLLPGPGFGDFSHPTTRLVLCMMAGHVQNKTVLDMGSGSGILAISSYALGARYACGIDIDVDAVLHARANAQHNGYEKNVDFLQVQKKAPSLQILLMNMIRSEQEIAIQSCDITAFDAVFTSGILTTERKEYLDLVHSWGLTCIAEQEIDGWLGFYLKQYDKNFI